MKNKRFTALFLALIISSFSAVGCSEEPSETTAETVQTEEAVSAETETEKLVPDLPEMDFEGCDFSVLTRGQYNVEWYSEDIYAEELTGEPINDAVFNRNVNVCSKYNFTIQELTGGSADPDPAVVQAVASGDNVYDMLMIGGKSCGNLATQQYLRELSAIPYMDLSKPWYDQSANASLSIGNRLYMTSGDINIMDNNATWAILFSKVLAEQLIDENLYTLVSEGKWTMDKMKEYCSRAYVDLNGNGTYDPDDQWALIGEPWNTMAFVEGGGYKTFEKDENDMPYITADSEGFYDRFLLAMSLNADSSHTMNDFSFESQFSDVWNDCMYKSFKEARALFHCTGMNVVPMMRDMESDFGIIPMPKYDVEQENYHCAVSIWAANMLSVPITASDADLERTGIIIEALSAESKYTLTPAYYTVTLKGKSARDEESAAMLDLIFSARTFDLGLMFSWGDLFDSIWKMTYTNSTDLSSTIESCYNAAVNDMQKTVDAILGN